MIQTQWEELSELAGTLPLHYTDEDLDDLLLKASEIFRNYGDEYWADFYLKIIKQRKEERIKMSIDLKDMRVWSFLPSFVTVLRSQLESDQMRYGNLWKEIPREGQETRIFNRFNSYFKEFAMEGTTIPWLKVAGLALIAWIRETYPEMFPE